MKIEKKWKKVREKMIVRPQSFRAFSQTSTRDLSRPITSGEQHRWLFARLKHSPFRRFCFWSRKRSEGVRWFISRAPYWATASGTRPRKFPKLFSPLSTDLSDHFLSFEILANPRPFRQKFYPYLRNCRNYTTPDRYKSREPSPGETSSPPQYLNI